VRPIPVGDNGRIGFEIGHEAVNSRPTARLGRKCFRGNEHGSPNGVAPPTFRVICTRNDIKLVFGSFAPRQT
jgi:hypothetical protein